MASLSGHPFPGEGSLTGMAGPPRVRPGDAEGRRGAGGRGKARGGQAVPVSTPHFFPPLPSQIFSPTSELA